MFVDKPVSIGGNSVGSQCPNGFMIQPRRPVRHSTIWDVMGVQTIFQIENCAKIIAMWAVVLMEANIKLKRTGSLDFAVKI